MQTFTLKIQKKIVAPLHYVIGTKKLNIKIISEQTLPGVIPSGEPDTELTLQLLSEDLSELITLGWFAAKEPLTFTLGSVW
jgi:hypothetical protein